MEILLFQLHKTIQNEAPETGIAVRQDSSQKWPGKVGNLLVVAINSFGDAPIFYNALPHIAH